ncbi:hypothetical protein Micbo1qcDRAFT_199100 [Microdochium bolleyi]|uniref:Short-chain dehydrogenase n=1 Tax=Microdochium bolleyi TaxID=196109 RepID=A0A136IJ25_9PEZI|nr:hypothetical protein Micbo1qcDRAFT_199100 [Microdochium bolleyi]
MSKCLYNYALMFSPKSARQKKAYGVAFDPKVDIPSFKDKVILVTGGTSGIGQQSVLEFAKHEPKEIWLAARNAAKAKEVTDKIKAEVPGANIRFVQIDIGSFASVRTAAKQILDGADRLDILLLNAGIMGVPAATTDEGYEIQFGTNLAATLMDGNWFAGAVIVFLSMIIGVDVPTGTLNQLWASTAKAKDIVSGKYYEPIGVTGRGKPQIYDQALAEKLWEWTEKELEGQTVG